VNETQKAMTKSKSKLLNSHGLSPSTGGSEDRSGCRCRRGTDTQGDGGTDASYDASYDRVPILIESENYPKVRAVKHTAILMAVVWGRLPFAVLSFYAKLVVERWKYGRLVSGMISFSASR
jgi:hypothetical protein